MTKYFCSADVEDGPERTFGAEAEEAAFDLLDIALRLLARVHVSCTQSLFFALSPYYLPQTFCLKQIPGFGIPAERPSSAWLRVAIAEEEEEA